MAPLQLFKAIFPVILILTAGCGHDISIKGFDQAYAQSSSSAAYASTLEDSSPDTSTEEVEE
ncbi:MAG: hypothetical protein A2284_18345 [Deltaproteobacteria bacterium RIFOXYA12_FULL_61_11]|nr:MAG: hypothetical protein A2284_18345 [Deltaproteobacteria bacterium RIFOXYA12_FULL_61_11]